MGRYGINPDNAYGIPIPTLRKKGKEIGTDHQLAAELWVSGVHEARILACYIDDPEQVTEEQMEAWTADFDSWDVCDQVVSNLFDKTPFAYRKALEWSARGEEFVKRAGFVMMASLAVHDKKAPDHCFVDFFPIIIREATDRNFVKKGVNWALSQIGKRNTSLNQAAIKTAEEINKIDSKTARWIASGALRELTSQKVQARFQD
jgi:3-methyladenine DNA glycosylase AlkD